MIVKSDNLGNLSDRELLHMAIDCLDFQPGGALCDVGAVLLSEYSRRMERNGNTSQSSLRFPAGSLGRLAQILTELEGLADMFAARVRYRGDFAKVKHCLGFITDVQKSIEQELETNSNPT